ncbi:PHP domain-containing protein [Robinsoniella peoriensis]
MTKTDLHIHSNYSDDGSFSVPEIMNMCKQSGIGFLSITDHNTVKGVAQAQALAGQIGLKVISGVELDCVCMGRNFHLLGYGFECTDPVFAGIEQSILVQERSAAKKKIELIREVTGIPIGVEEVLGVSEDGVVTGELIAELLLKKENAKDNPILLPYRPGGKRSDNPFVNFYWDYFSQGKQAYVPIKYISMEEAVDLIHAAGGIAVLAHPGQNLQGDYAFLQQIVKMDLDGIEAYSSYHCRMEITYFIEIAQENNLLITCGSDFHGNTKPSIRLGGHGADEEMSALIRERIMQV